VAGSDYTAPVVTTITWADGDTAPKTVTIPLLKQSGHCGQQNDHGNTQWSGQRIAGSHGKLHAEHQ